MTDSVALNTYMEQLEEFFDKKNPSLEEINEAETLLNTIKKMDARRKNKVKISEYTTLLADLKRKKLVSNSKNSQQGQIDENNNGESIQVQKSKESLEVLKRARDKLLETEELGKGTLVKLQENHETLNRINKNVKQVNDTTKRGNRILDKLKTWWRG
jgi:hypothetical protein